MGAEDKAPTASNSVWTDRRVQSHAALRRALVRRGVDSSTDLAPSSALVDPSIYLDTQLGQRERRAFLRLPILVALTQDLPQPGDKFLFDALGPEVLLIRNRGGVVNAFLNLCMHRGARLVRDCDRRGQMTCPFHGWTYDLDGRLIGLPGAAGFADMDRAGRALQPVAVAEWGGMIFVRVSSAEPIDVPAHLGSFADELLHLELDQARPMKHSRVECRANWKYAWDTYCENYHFGTLHATTVAPRVVSNVSVMTPYGRHARMGFLRKDWLPLANIPESEWPPSDYGGNYFIFPNINMNVSVGPNGQPFYGFYHLYPGLTSDQCLTRMATYRPAHAAGAHADDDWRCLHDFIENVVVTEDYHVAAEGQRNLQHAPPALRTVFGANEILCQKWHRDWRDTLSELGV